jgi:hypothetical protein
MKMKGNDTIIANKEADMSDCGYKEEEEPSPYLCFPFPFDEIWRHIWTYLKKASIQFYRIKTLYYNNNM